MAKIAPLETIVLQLSDIEIAWLAGLLEGEGSFGIDDRSATRYEDSTAPAVPRLELSMVDEDVIAKVARLLRKNYFKPETTTVKQKLVYKGLFKAVQP